MKIAILFPGQGSQYVGMGKDLYDNFSVARDVFNEVDDSLLRNLSKLIFSGDSKELTLTSNAQPAIMAVSIAIARVIEDELKMPIFDYFGRANSTAAGHSLGEYSALCFARSISLQDTAKLLKIRGESMESALSEGVAGMLALLGADLKQVEELLIEVSKIGLCEIANDNGAGQIVLSGYLNAIDKAVELSPNYGIKKAVRLNVSAPFHSSLMSKALEPMIYALENVNIGIPNINVISNYSTDVYNSTIKIRQELEQQIVSKVRWRETMDKLANDYQIEKYLELGPGKILSGIVKRIDPEKEITNIENTDGVRNFLESLKI